MQGINSRNRHGDYFADCLSKLREIVLIAKQNNCEAIFDCGDLFETKNPAYNVIDSVADIIEDGGVPIYSLFGNHAMSYGHIENSGSTGLKHLQNRSKLFRYLDRLTDDFKTYDIRGFDYYFGIEEELKKGIYWQERNDDKIFKIAIIHAMITPSKFFEKAFYVLPEQIKTNANLIICGHYHTPFYKKVGNTEFVNIGCCGRLNINEAKIEPSVLLLDTEKRNWEIIKLKSAKPANQIFDLEHYNTLKKEEKSIEDFINSLKSVNFQGMKLGEQIVKVGKENKVNQNVVDYLLEKINEK
jgi:DNA repair exonuclease SbcCD nuclease subunit